MQTIGKILVSVTGGWQTSSTWVVRGCDGRETYGWDVSQQFLRRSKDRRLGLKPNSFSDGWQTDAGDSSRLGIEPISFSVGRRTDACASSWIGLEPNSFAVGWQTDVCDLIWLGLESMGLSSLGLESSIVLGILCAKKFRFSQFWEHGNWQWYNYTNIHCSSLIFSFLVSTK